MERSKIIIIAITLMLMIQILSAQGLFVHYQHPVYSFLDRMEASGIISNYANETKPLLRSKIVSYLSEIFDKRFELNKTDRKFLSYFIDEFYFDITGKLDRYEILFSSENYSPLSNKEKFIYAYSMNNEFSIFVKSHINSFLINSKDQRFAHLIEGGGRFYGNFRKILGFEFDATNGFVFGSKSTALNLHELSYNFKLLERPEERFFDRSYSYVMVEFPFLNFGIGKIRQTIGYGINQLILSDYGPEFEKIFLNLNYKAFSIEFLHGWLQNSRFHKSIPEIPKFFAHHRLSFSPINNLKLGVGESIIYSRTSPELAYLNPLNFYKSIEHQLQDKDNALLYFDFEFLIKRNVRLYSTFLIDDIDFAKIGKNWYGNKTAFSIGSNFYYPIPEIPIHLQIEYSRIEPYTYTHRFNNISYTSLDLPLATEQPPNSFRVSFKLDYETSPNFNINLLYSFTKHGSNYFYNNKFVNVGGDINSGFDANNDSELLHFLAGKTETIHDFELNIVYEILRNIKLNSKIDYSKAISKKSFLILSFGFISFL